MNFLLPNECPNCGRPHDHDFAAMPGPVQSALAEAEAENARLREGGASILDLIRKLGFVGNSHYCPGCMNEFWADHAQHEPDCPILHDIREAASRQGEGAA